ncbi:MAG: CHASE2 domain-containing protein [Verrucomicrobia bacterium]|nr:CHASE2 domain-containing protein [Verrucomicrobiota bacterium]
MFVFGNPFQSLDNAFLDQMLRWRYQAGLAPPVDPHIVHLDVASEDVRVLSSLRAEYQHAAEIIQEATTLGAKAIALDIIFERGSSEDARPILEAIDAAKANNTVVVLAEAFSGSPPARERSFPFLARRLPAGLMNLEPDTDGVFRRYLLLRNEPSGIEPSFALATYLAWRGIDWEKDVKFPQPRMVSWPELRADDSGIEWRTADLRPVLENFRSGWQGVTPAGFRHYSVTQLHQLYAAAHQVVTENSPETNNSKPLADCVVLVSYVGSGIGDLGNTPLGQDQPRVLLHSVALNDLIQRSFLRLPSGPACAWSAGLLIPLGFVMGFWRRNRMLIGFWFVMTVGWLLVSFALVCFSDNAVPTVAIAAVWSIAVGGELLRRRLFPILPPVIHPVATDKSPVVFISAKSADYPHAGTVHRFLMSRGIPTFLSNESLPRLGKSDYRKEIDRALDCCQHMIVVTSSVENVASAWVEAEWGIFVNEQRSGRKKGNLITVTTKPLETSKLPPALRSNEIILLNESALEKIAAYVCG